MPAELEEVVLRCLAKERSRRFASAQRAGAWPCGRRSSTPPRASAQASAPKSRLAPAQHRSVAVLFLRSGANPLAVQKALTWCGGQLAFREGTRFAAVFDPETETNPLQRAHLCAERLCAEGITTNAAGGRGHGDGCSAAPTGPPRYLTPLFSRRSAIPARRILPRCCSPRRRRRACRTCAASRCPSARASSAERGPRRSTRTPACCRWATACWWAGQRGAGRAGARRARGAGERAPHAASVLSERGHGKSHLGAALVQRLREECPRPGSYSLRAREPVQGDPWAPCACCCGRHSMASSGRPRLGGRGPPCLLRAAGAGAGQELWPGVASTLGWSAPDSPELQSRGRGAGCAALAGRARHGRAAGRPRPASARCCCCWMTRTSRTRWRWMRWSTPRWPRPRCRSGCACWPAPELRAQPARAGACAPRTAPP